MTDPDSTPSTESEAIYKARTAQFREDHDALAGAEQRLSNLRLIAGFVFLTALIWFVLKLPPVAIVVAVLSGVVFSWLIVRHRRTAQARIRAGLLRDINQEALHRIARNWQDLPLNGDNQIPAGHAFATDLDVIGRASLFHLLDTTATSIGAARLSDWLITLVDPVETRRRQLAVQELAPLIAWRQELQMLGRLTQPDRRDPTAFLEWAESEPILPDNAWILWLARFGAAATVGIVLLAILRLVPPPVVVFPLIANLIIGLWGGHLIGNRVNVAREQHQALKSYSQILRHIDTQSFSSPLMAELLDQLGSRDRPAHLEVSRLGRITSFAVPRSAISHFGLQALGNWDIHVLDGLERWQQDNGQHVRQWLEIIGTVEALSALAGLAGDNPTWVFPDIDERHTTFDATQLGHPLIAATVRVCNDVHVGPPGTFLLVTGSNMSGKSTLLRSIGINIVLASVGGPCCAHALTTAPFDLWTSVRVTDSLEAGVSFYMAELLRLKSVYEAAAVASRQHRPFCYLLDEILQGTNSAERQIAAREIISRLIGLGAIGAVSTHDLHLADSPELAESAVPVHFSDQFSEGPEGMVMSFDYQLRAGVATSTNALNLMRIVGFEPGDGRTLSADSVRGAI